MAVRVMDIFSGQNSELLLKIFNHVKEDFPKTVAEKSNILAGEALLMWAEDAGKASSWGKRYASTLSFKPMRPDAKGGTAEVYADEKHPNYLFVTMTESGVKSWSIKDALLAGKAAKRNLQKYGTVFVRVPFRYRTPGTGKATSLFAGVMPEDVYKMAKSGQNIGAEFGRMAGLKRYTEGLHTGYFTFRTVSPKSEGWEHPGKEATPVFEKVQAKVEKMIAISIDKWIKEFLKDIEKEFK